MTSRAYIRFELLRTFRNRRFVIFSLGFPLVLYAMLVVPNRHDQDFGGTGVPFALYYMVGLASFGTMMAMVSSGARIANERTTGWTRQLRITPLTSRAYFRAKVLTAYTMATTTIVLLFALGAASGVSLPAGEWARMALLMLIGLAPFAALGIVLGHLMTSDAIGPLTGGVVSLLALVSGTWVPVAEHGFMHALALGLPSYWLVQASNVGIGGDGWTTTGWIVVIAWTVALARLARVAYRRDTARV